MSGVSRRAALGAVASLAAGGLATVLVPAPAGALGRTRNAGKLGLGLPWSLRAIDPHDPFDGAAAILTSSIVHSLYELDGRGVPFPSLADGPPIADKGGCIVKLRPGIVTARGAAIQGRDVVFSLSRARRLGGLPDLAKLSEPRVQPGEALHVAFARGEKSEVMRILASPLAAIVPRGFDPKSPDGTGPFRATLDAGRVSLARNMNAATGPSFFEALTFHETADLATSLRDFETERDDVGWLGAGFHGKRKDSTGFDFGRVGWFVLFVGGDLGKAGEAQRLADELPRQSLAHLGLGVLPSRAQTRRYEGRPCDLLVEQGAPHLRALADALAAQLGSPGHEITVRVVQRSERERRVHRNDPIMAVGVVRPLGRGVRGDAVALTSFVDPEAAERLARAPSTRPETAREAGNQLSVGVVGELRVAGAVRAGVRLVKSPQGGADWGASSLAPTP